jgi:hypothetical protein
VKSETDVRAFPFPNPALAAIKITSSNILTLICSPFEEIFRIETCKLTGKPLLFNIWYKQSIYTVLFLPAMAEPFKGRVNPDSVRPRGKMALSFRPSGMDGWDRQGGSGPDRSGLVRRSVSPNFSFIRRPRTALDRALPPWGRTSGKYGDSTVKNRPVKPG